MFAVALLVFVENVYEAANVKRWSKENYPYDAIQYIKENNLEGNVYNYYSWGGYLIWQLPEKKTFIDGRMPSWRENGSSVFEDYIGIQKDIESNYDLFDSYVEKYDIRIVLVKEDSESAEYLIEKVGWKKCFKDKAAVVLVSDGICDE